MRCLFLCPLIVFLVTPFVFLYVLTGSKHETKQKQETLINPPDLFLISTYYYTKSLSLGDNALALLMSIDFDELDNSLKQIEVVAANRTNEIRIKASVQRVTPHDTCRLITAISFTNILSNPTTISLNIGDTDIEIPFKRISVSSPRRPVVHCIAPLFASEQWQTAIFALHTYRRFGSMMHLYSRSVVSPLYELLRIYDLQGYAKIIPWPRLGMKFVPEADFNPNLNVEFRNQAAAQTDCLLQNKESVEFISFVDLDDILLPRADSYFDEFNQLFLSMPEIAYAHYVKLNAHVNAASRGSEFDLREMFTSVRFEGKTETGKLVAKPNYINSTWIHWPSAVPKRMIGYDVPPSTNYILHLKHISFIKKNHPDATQLDIDNGKIDEIIDDYRSFLNYPKTRKFVARMPSSLVYFYAIDKCFHDTFYKYHESGRQNVMRCPGPERCQLPNYSEGCWNALAEFDSTQGGLQFNLHFPVSTNFERQSACIV